MPLLLAAVVALFSGLAAGLSGYGAEGAVAALAVAPVRWGRVGRGVPLALVLAAAALTGDLTRRHDAACRVWLAARPSWNATLQLEDAAPGSRVHATLSAGDCSAAATLMVAEGSAPAGGRVTVAGPATATDRGLAIVPARIGPPTGSDPMLVLRARAAHRLDALLGDQAPMARALLVADTRDLSVDLRDRFADAGLIHALSISGLHVAIVAAALTLLLGALRTSPRVATVGALVATGAYVVLLGVPAPAVRSAVMLAGHATAKLLQRPTSRWAILAWGALIPLVLDVRAALDIGYQLSVAGMAALACASAFARRVVDERLDGWRAKVAESLVAGAAVCALTAPLVAWHIGRLSLVAPLTNLAADPVLALLQPALFVVLALGGTDGPARVAAAGATPLLMAFDAIARAGAAIPGASLSLAPSPVTAVCTGVAAIAFGVACLAKRPIRAALAGVAALAVVLWWPMPPGTGNAELHMIDVGQGDALALRTPRGRWILIDAGPAFGTSDAGRSVVAPYLRRLGGDVVALIITHPDADHVGGAASVMRATHPGLFLDPAFAGTSDIYAGALRESQRDHVGWRAARAGDSLVVDGVVVSLLAPDSAWMAGAASPNDASVIARVRYGDVRFLLTGDAEAPEEAWLVNQWGADALRADVLKVGHHGSSTSSSAMLRDAVRPRIALVSVGSRNRYGHPNPGVMAAFAHDGVQVLRTDRLGTVVVQTDGRALRVRAGGEEWEVARTENPRGP